MFNENSYKDYNIDFNVLITSVSTVALKDDPFFGKYPAVTENRYGKGSLIYEGCLVTDEIQSAIVSMKGVETGIIAKEGNITYPVVIRQGTNDLSKTIRYYLNYSDKDVSVPYNHTKGINLFTNMSLKRGDAISLKPWDVIIIEE